MIKRYKMLREFKRDSRGAVVIETAFVVPILGVLALGGFEASMIVSRHAEIQSAAAEATAIVLARVPEDASERSTIEAVIETSTGLAADKVSLSLKYRCDTGTTIYNNDTSCSSTAVISEYIEIQMTDTYTPVWADFGFGGPINYNITRRVQIA